MKEHLAETLMEPLLSEDCIVEQKLHSLFYTQRSSKLVYSNKGHRY